MILKVLYIKFHATRAKRDKFLKLHETTGVCLKPVQLCSYLDKVSCVDRKHYNYYLSIFVLHATCIYQIKANV